MRNSDNTLACKCAGGYTGIYCNKSKYFSAVYYKLYTSKVGYNSGVCTFYINSYCSGADNTKSFFCDIDVKIMI